MSTTKPAFDPSSLAVRNGNFFGLPYTVAEADIVIVPAPWDLTTSYREGTVHGPASMLEASYQVDFISPLREKAWELRIATLPVSSETVQLNVSLNEKKQSLLTFLEEGGDVSASDAESKKMAAILKELNATCADFHTGLAKEVEKLLQQGKTVITLGGEHSVSLGPIESHLKVLAPKFSDGLSVLHIDAHADLRFEYEGFAHSHASIMERVSRFKGVRGITQVGIRDVSPEEIAVIDQSKNPANGRCPITTYFDWDLKNALYDGESWKQVCARIIATLGQNVYISFDIDGLDPKLCPSTGTPVFGGMELEQVHYLFDQVRKSGRRIVGADLVEVSPPMGQLGTGDDWDSNVGARALFALCCLVG